MNVFKLKNKWKAVPLGEKKYYPQRGGEKVGNMFLRENIVGQM